MASRRRQSFVAELYAAKPSAFVAARAAAAKRTKDPQLKKALAQIRKPTPVLWAINALAREADVEVRALLATGKKLRGAQKRALAGDAAPLRDALAEERQLLSRLVARAAAILHREGKGATQSTTRRLRQTLNGAALGDDAVHAALAAGALETELDVTGFEVLGDLGDLPTPARAPKPVVAHVAKQAAVKQAAAKKAAIDEAAVKRAHAAERAEAARAARAEAARTKRDEAAARTLERKAVAKEAQAAAPEVRLAALREEAASLRAEATRRSPRRP